MELGDSMLYFGGVWSMALQGAFSTQTNSTIGPISPEGLTRKTVLQCVVE